MQVKVPSEWVGSRIANALDCRRSLCPGVYTAGSSASGQLCVDGCLPASMYLGSSPMLLYREGSPFSKGLDVPVSRVARFAGDAK